MNTASTATARSFRAIGKCRNGHFVNTTWDVVNTTGFGAWVICPCGSKGVARSLEVKNTKDTECGPRCTGATGPMCDCKCGGENHGGSHHA